MCTFLRRLAKDERGSHTTEMALAIALFALIAGFGFFAFGDALATFFFDLGVQFQNAGNNVPDFNTPPSGATPSQLRRG
jgi:Flp pilus assembly pilin Flp